MQCLLFPGAPHLSTDNLPLITEGLRQRSQTLKDCRKSEARHSRLPCLQRHENAGPNIYRAHIVQTCICEVGSRARCRCSTFATTSGLQVNLHHSVAFSLTDRIPLMIRGRHRAEGFSPTSLVPALLLPFGNGLTHGPTFVASLLKFFVRVLNLDTPPPTFQHVLVLGAVCRLPNSEIFNAMQTFQRHSRLHRWARLLLTLEPDHPHNHR